MKPKGSGAQTELDRVVQRNIDALLEVRRANEARRTREQRLADAVTRFTGSMASVYVHVALFGGWVLLNTGVVPFVRPWDPFPFVMLAAAASVEAIFLTTFVLISQNRMSVLSEQRAELDLQISLLAEHEVTRLVEMVGAIGERLGLTRPPGVEALERDVHPEQVIDEIERARGSDA